MSLEQQGFATTKIHAPEIIFYVTDGRQPGRSAATASWNWLVVFGQNTPHHILVNLGLERFGYLLSDSGAAEPWVAGFHLDDCVDDLLGRALGTWFCLSLTREEPAVFTFLQRLVELEYRALAHDDSYPSNPGGLDNDGPEAQQEPIRGGQIGRPFARTVGDDELVPHRQVFGNEAFGATGAQQFGDGDDSVDEEYETSLHGMLHAGLRILCQSKKLQQLPGA